MSDDLVKRLRNEYPNYLTKKASNRIEELEAEVKSTAMDCLVAHGQAFDAYQAQLAAQTKLAKAMEALGDATQILSQCTWATMYVQGQYVGRKELVESYRTTLAELKGDSDG